MTTGLTIERRHLRRGLAAVLASATLALLLVQMPRAPETHPMGDTAITSIATLRAARGDLTTGVYSRFRWNHPGPLLYQALAPLYTLSGHREISIKWTVLILNIAALAGLLTVVAGPAPLLSVLIAAALAPLLWQEQRLLFWGWNPIVPLLPLAFATALAARIATGALRFLPLFAALASFAIQTHVGFVPVVLSLTATIVGVLTWTRWQQQWVPSKSDLIRVSVISATVVAVLWAVPVVHEFTTPERNLSKLIAFFSTESGQQRGWGTAFAIMANQMVAPWTGKWEITTIAEAPSTASAAVFGVAIAQLLLLLAASVVAFRRGAAFRGAFALMVLAASAMGLLAVRSIVGAVSDYLVVWPVVLGALGLAAIVTEVIHLAIGSDRSFRWCRQLLAAYTIAAAVLGGTRLVDKHAVDARSVVVRTLTTVLQRYCEKEGIDRPLLRFSGPAWQAAAGVVLQFYKDGRPIAVSDDMVFLVGEPFKATGRESGAFYFMMLEDTAMPEDITRHTWVTTFGGYRVVQVFRE